MNDVKNGSWSTGNLPSFEHRLIAEYVAGIIYVMETRNRNLSQLLYTIDSDCMTVNSQMFGVVSCCFAIYY